MIFLEPTTNITRIRITHWVFLVLATVMMIWWKTLGWDYAIYVWACALLGLFAGTEYHSSIKFAREMKQLEDQITELEEELQDNLKNIYSVN